MFARVSTVLASFALSIFACTSASLAQTATAPFPPIVEGELVDSDPSCSTSASAPIEFEDAFATRIRSQRVLRFLVYLDRVPESEQMRVFTKIEASPRKFAVSQAERGCRTVAGVATMRALYLMANRWTVSLGGPGDAKFDAFTRAVEAAIVTLLEERAADSPAALPGDLPSLAPFAYAPARSVDAVPAPAPCTLAHEDAHAIVLSQPAYPQIARANRTQGTIFVRVIISDRGLVENAKLFRSTATEQAGGRALAQAAILAASETTYAPERFDCVTRAGAYLFGVTFNGR